MLLSKTVWEPITSSKECFSMKLDLLANATVIEDAIRFVSQKAKEKIKSSSSNSNEDNKESRELGYDEHEGQLGEKQEEETGEIGASTINQSF
jgi:hypothetical protein